MKLAFLPHVTILMVTLTLCAPALVAQQLATPGDSVRIQFSPTDIWHLGIVTDRFRDTLIVSGCSGCLHDPFVMAPGIRVEARRERDATTGHSAVIGFILGAVGGALAGTLLESGCSSYDSNRTGSKCSGLSGPTLGLAGGLIGAITGAVTGRRQGYKRWEQVARTPARTSPRFLVHTRAAPCGCIVAETAALVHATDLLGHPSM